MKTAGTSLRGMLEERLGTAGVYPSSEDLAVLPRGWYPGPRELLERDAEGESHGAKVLVGHVPYVLADLLHPRPFVTTVLREPVARTVSLLEHRRRTTPARRDASYRELLEDEELVENQIRDYQTKVFGFDSLDECSDHVNRPLVVDDARFERAMTRLEATDLVGLTDDLAAYTRELERRTGIGRLRQRRSNRGTYGAVELPPDDLRRILELTRRDRLLYDRARQLAPRSRSSAVRLGIDRVVRQLSRG